MRWVICFSLFFLFVSCSPHVEGEKVEKPPEKVVDRDEATGGLPCFKCHSYDRFASREKGVFPHMLHRDTGYHCNQCHDFKGHRPMKINADLCRDCHGLKMISFASSGFPAEFNHEFHSRMGCKECHLGIFPMKKGTTKIVMDEIYKGRLCGECHNGERAFASSECARCHDMKKFDRDVMYKVQGIGNVVFNHKFHLSIYKCQDCHTKFFAMKRTQGKMTMDAMNSGKFCGGCHNGTLATSVSQCKKCHKP